MSTKPTIVVVGAGQRGLGYSNYLFENPEEGKIVAVCDPNEYARNTFGDKFDIPMDMRFKDWRDIVDMPKLADAAFVCTQDKDHKDPAIALAKKGYHLMLEKPMAPNPEDCQAIYDAAKESGVMLAVCHVLRYTTFNKKLKQMIDSGLIGKVHSIQLIEPVGYWHQAHSYVRGNWRNEALSSPMLLAKSCHDMDLLNYFIPSKCAKVSSFGSLSHFTRANQPEGAADRCTECPESIESKCPYSALKIYFRDRGERPQDWPVSVITTNATAEGVMEALKTGPYGRCVYACDNDVVDHQVVNLEFEDKTTASFTMAAFNESGPRQTLIMGDKGSLRCHDAWIEHVDFLTDKKTTIDIDNVKDAHGGGDHGLVGDFICAVRENDPSYITSDASVSLESHLIVFAAEKSRRNSTVEKI